MDRYSRPSNAVKDRTLTEHSIGTHGRKAGRPVAGVLLLHSRGSVAPRAFPVNGPVTLGRDDEATISVDDAGVSRLHAQLTPRGDQIWVEDLGSRNRTFVDGFVVATGGASVKPGSLIRAAKTLLVVLADVTPYFGDRDEQYPELLGGAALDDARFRIRSISAKETTVLILGETGTGKEVVARLLHRASGRSGPFVALNCAAVPSELVDAELFGHAKGAFSGAAAARSGLFRAADGGTLFLDEIGELPAAVQAKLLRVLETAEVRAVGDDRSAQVDVRVISATNRDVDSMIESSQFRSDLLFRLSGLRIPLPPLRDRLEDIPALAEHFLKPLGMRITANALERLMLRPWPGNVRELKNIVTAAAAVAKERDADEIEADDVAMIEPQRTRSSASEPAKPSSEDVEHERLREVLTHVSGNVALAAAELGMRRSTLYEALRRARINPKAFRRRT